jgi:hypothetical protein
MGTPLVIEQGDANPASGHPHMRGESFNYCPRSQAKFGDAKSRKKGLFRRQKNPTWWVKIKGQP